MAKKKINKPEISSILNPNGPAIYKTERSAVSDLMHWMSNIIDEKKIRLGAPDVETSGEDRKMPDLVIYDSPASNQVLCVLEAKLPYFNVYDYDELILPARNKANIRKARYFATTNFKTLIWFDTAKANNPSLPEQEQIIDIYDLSGIENLDDIRSPRYSEPIKRMLEQFLRKLYLVASGKETAPKLPIDDRLVRRLQETIRVLSSHYRYLIFKKYQDDNTFRKNIHDWLQEQNWSLPLHKLNDFDQIARQSAYLLINKILFYDLLQPKWPAELDPIDIPETVTKGYTLRNDLEAKFNYVSNAIDYETIFATDFIDIIALPDSDNVVKEIKALCNVLKRYNFAAIPYDIIGRIFEQLIPDNERHKLGQYFTPSEVVDMILAFCLNHEDDLVLDPGCGAGTFLKRAYQQKKLMNNRLSHEKLLDTIWGNDIAKFPATLSTINLAINDLSATRNYPNIIQEDFFAITVSDKDIDLSKWRLKRAQTLGKDIQEIDYPHQFDAIVGNPPYTRQEEIDDMGVEKRKLIENALLYDDKPLAALSRRAGIFAYFFVHGTKFLKENGYFGFVVSDSWLDADYGKGLQEHFLSYYKIIAIIDSKIERWFPDADINTCIIIMQKCSDKNKRDNNLVRFVYLKKPLTELVPAAEDIWDQELERKNDIIKLKNTILSHNTLYENDDMRIYPISQKTLWEEAFDKETDSFSGAKWGKYLKAPEIFFKIVKIGRKKLIQLKEIAEIKRGFTTGANEYFYLTENELKRKKIEKEFWMHKDDAGNKIPNYVITRPNESKQIKIDKENLKYRVLLIDKKRVKSSKKYISSYIAIGKKQNFDKRSTCKSREPQRAWYDLGEDINYPIAFPERNSKRYIVFYNPDQVSINKNLYGIKPKLKSLAKPICMMLNSTLYAMLFEINSRQPGGGGGPLDTDVAIVEEILFPVIENIKKYRNQLNNSLDTERRIGDIFTELGASSADAVTLDTVLPDRRELDKIVMGEIFGLSDDEQLEVYKAVIDLVKSRLEKARSVDDNSDVNVAAYAALIDETIDNLVGDK